MTAADADADAREDVARGAALLERLIGITEAA